MALRRAGSTASMNRNVHLGLCVSFLGSASRGVWAFTTLSVYIRMMADSAAAVGLAEGIQGVAQALAAVAAGVAADRVRRDTVIWASGALGLAACGAFFYALLAPESSLHSTQRFWMLTLALAMMGAYQGMSTTCMDTLFADSVRTGQRGRFNTYRFVLMQVSSVSGPTICVILFSEFGNVWTLERVTSVFVVGIVLSIVPIIVSFFLSDDHSLGLDSESHYVPSTPGRESMNYQRIIDDGLDEDGELDCSNEQTAVPLLHEPHLNTEVHAQHLDFQSFDNEGGNGNGNSGETESVSSSSTSSSDSDIDQLGSWYCIFGYPGVAAYLVLSDVISALGSGMTVKFFPLFFKRKLGLSPVELNGIYMVLPVFMTLVSLAALRAAKQIGRAQACFVLSCLGSVALFVLAYAEAALSESNAYIILPIYFFTTLQHCSRPLRKAILMDFVPKSRRAKYNSIESVTRLNWSGSAFLGGYSIDRFGFGSLFFVNAVVQLVSLAFLYPITNLVPVKEMTRHQYSAYRAARSGR
mmetsp:Transcript_20141/g.37434  ORF Transcript_20141/g.37434 Transcript_20141/m.37434 type:complete len:525 (-) Transcript_20141:490-2064(-)